MSTSLLLLAKRFVGQVLSQFRSVYVHVRSLGFGRGVCAWFQVSILDRQFEVSVTTPGLSNPVILRVGTSDIEVYQKVFMDWEYALPFESQPRTIVDLGANTGMATLYFHSCYPEAEILAVEPDPVNFAMLKHNVGHLPNVTCVQAAVWSHDGEITLIDPGIGSWGMQVTDAAYQQQGTTVTAVSVPTLLQRFTGGHVDLLKVDIEGAEREVFSSSAGWIERVNAIVIELHDRYKAGCGRAFFTAVGGLPNEKWIGENLFVWRKP